MGRRLHHDGATSTALDEIASEPTFRIVDGVSIRFVESDQRDADALLLSPWPESVFAYEPTWSRLAESTHLVAIDLPGFGRFERRDTHCCQRARWVTSLLARPTRLASSARTWSGRTLGRRDTVVPTVNAEYLHERLPHSELRLLDTAHFVWEDAADEYAALLSA
jgi:pimeloyl-ACP methyl ester carboxylesterase